MILMCSQDWELQGENDVSHIILSTIVGAQLRNPTQDTEVNSQSPLGEMW